MHGLDLAVALQVRSHPGQGHGQAQDQNHQYEHDRNKDVALLGGAAHAADCCGLDHGVESVLGQGSCLLSPAVHQFSESGSVCVLL